MSATAEIGRVGGGARIVLYVLSQGVPMIRSALLACALLGCGDPPADCTDIEAASTLVHVTGEGDEPLVAEVTAVDADGNDVDVVCAGDDADACTDWTVGYEVTGEITITGDAYDGCNYGNGVLVVDVPLDESGCHPVLQEVELEVLEWTDRDCLPAER